jgi:uncharacterized repeat protein (TIGR03837 family)
VSARPALWIFCRVIDNFGDAGICGRLARQMADEHRFAVSLFIDLPETLEPLAPQLRLAKAGTPDESPGYSRDSSRSSGDSDPSFQPLERRSIAHETAEGLSTAHDGSGEVRVIQWVEGDEAGMLGRAHRDPVAIVSGFGCDLPAGVRAGLGTSGRAAPVWVDFEYLSAEDWVESFHGRASPKPQDSAVAHYFFPGFTPLTGGLLRERDLDERRIHFQASGKSARFLAGLGLADQGEDSRLERRVRPDANRTWAHATHVQPRTQRISLFCYPNAPLSDWLQAVAESEEPTLVCATAPIASAALSAAGASPDADRFSRGNLQIRRLPMLSQDDYDRLLWCCDLNIVRGEDSWIRAHWAARPFIWQPYPQSEGVHLTKLEAFLKRMSDMTRGRLGLATEADDVAIAAIDAMMLAWSTGKRVAKAWQHYQVRFGEVRRLHEAWRLALLTQSDLASRLAAFISDRLR